MKLYWRKMEVYHAGEKNYHKMASFTFEDFLTKIQHLQIDQSLMRFLISAAFNSKSHMQNHLLEMLYGYNSALFLSCFFGKNDENDHCKHA